MMKRSQPILRHLSQWAARPALPMKASLWMLLPLVALPGPSIAQAIPAATAPSSPPASPCPAWRVPCNTLSAPRRVYSSNYFGNSGVNSSTNLSGDLAFITNSALYPFNTVFSGGRAWSSSGQSSYDFFNLSMTQGIHAQRWTLALSDSVNYLPGTATTGLSGVPGVAIWASILRSRA